MNSIIVDTNTNFTELLCNDLGKIGQSEYCLKIDNELIDIKSSKCSVIAQAIVATYNLSNGNCFDNEGKNKDDLLHIFINIEGEFDKAKRQEQKGVEILMWLRCKYKICNPVILYSFQSNQQLLKAKPEHLIINSEGCYHFQLPYDFNKIKDGEFKGLEKKDWVGLRKYLKTAFDIDQIKHSSANWFGMIILLAVLNALNEDINQNILNDNNGEESFIEYANSLEFFLLDSFFSLSKIDIDNSIIKEVLKLKKETIDLRLKILNTKPYILFIDDMAKKGWAKLLCYSIFGNEKDDNFKVSESLSETDISKIYKKVENEIKNQRTDIVLLDLRLKNETGKQELSNLDGFKLLIRIKNKFPGLPVIITSASNDGKTFKSLIKEKAESIWTKPGIQEQMDLYKSLLRFKDLLEQIHHAHFKFSKVDFKDKVKVIEKIDWIKYRLFLYDKDFNELKHESISNFTDIFIDTNFLLTLTEKTDDKISEINLAESIGNLYKLAYLTTDFKKKFFVVDRCKVIIMNVIIDELLKKSKNVFGDVSKAGQFAYSIIMQMFSENIIHTEINKYNLSGDKYLRELKDPKENVYADGFILDELGNYLVTKKKKFKYYDFNRKSDASIYFDLIDKNVLLITNDADLTSKAISLCEGKDLTVWKVSEMNNIMNEIKL